MIKFLQTLVVTALVATGCSSQPDFHVEGEALPYAEINANDVEDEAKLAAEEVVSFVQDKVGFND